MLDHQVMLLKQLEQTFFLKMSLVNYIHQYQILLDGITRREVIKIAKSKGIKVIERKIKPEEMKNFVGCFLTGTAAEVTPVSKINDYNFKVCNVISDLNDAYQNLVRKKDSAA